VTVLVLVIGVLLGASAAGLTFRVLQSRGQTITPEPILPSPPSAEEQGGEQREFTSIRAALDALPIGVVYVDSDGAVVVRNRMAEHSTGMRHGDILVEEALEQVLRLAVGGADQTRLLELAGPPPKALVIHAVAVESGGTLATITDVTERQRIDAVRTDFVANISHELKTPVGAMSLLAETLADVRDPADVERFAQRIVAEAERLNRTIEDLLELAQIELGAQAERFPLQVAEVVEAAVDRVRATAERSGVTIAVTLDQPDVTVVGNRVQLVSAVGNLVDNAVKYSDVGGVVRVSAGREGNRIVFRVQDSGIGIAPQHLERIFERFYRVDRARSRGTGGVGLGLSIVRHVASNHGGEVNVSSQEGEGSMFELNLPDGNGRT
jgi:two-component system sensor histidine kinase SenX3